MIINFDYEPWEGVMIVCVCNGVSDRTIEANIKSSAFSTVRSVAKACGAGTDCGACVNTIRQFVLQHQAAPTAAPSRSHPAADRP